MKKIISLLVASIMIISLAACAPNDEEVPEEPTTEPIEDNASNEEDQEDTQDEEDQEDEIVDEDEKDEVEEDEVEEDQDEEDQDEEQVETNEKDVNLYFTNPDYVETGNEDLEKVKPENRTIDYEDTILEEAVVKELLKGPEDESLDNGIPSSITLIDVELIDGTAYVNFEGEGMSGSSLQEILTLHQILESLLNLDSVDAVQFLIDGEIAESLMGHIVTEEPFTELP